VLGLEAVGKCYVSKKRKTVVLENICLNVHKGQWVGIHGPNGVGKSVLCRLIAGLEGETSGRFILRKQISSSTQRRESVGYVFQFPALQLPFIRIGQVVTQALQLDQRAAFYERIAKVFPSARPSTRLTALSPHEQRLVILALLLARNVKILILDEPTWGADADEVFELLKMLTDSEAQERAVIVVSHNDHLLAMTCDVVYYLHDGILSETDTA
jgi:ABC-type Mn2+/Zn2+ transport system ATPase subunit